MAKKKTATDHTRQLKDLVVEQIPIGAIAPNDYNPNRQSPEDFLLLIKSMRDDGFTQPVIVHQEKNPQGKFPIVDGEHRWTAAIVVAELRDRGMFHDGDGNPLELDIGVVAGMRERRASLADKHKAVTVPAVRVNMTAEQMRVATLRHNRARGTEDVDLAADVFRSLGELGALGWAQEALSMSDAELSVALDGLENISVNELDWQPSDDPGDVASTTFKALPAAAQADPLNRIRAAETARLEGDRKMAEKESRAFRLSLVFSGDEAVLVREQLGDNPKARVLAWCANPPVAPVA